MESISSNNTGDGLQHLYGLQMKRYGLWCDRLFVARPEHPQIFECETLSLRPRGQRESL